MASAEQSVLPAERKLRNIQVSANRSRGVGRPMFQVFDRAIYRIFRFRRRHFRLVLRPRAAAVRFLGGMGRFQTCVRDRQR